tara:strand:- start:183 stop:389 length:207 start_codon:yes stop_codon:yes gene_type:complete
VKLFKDYILPVVIGMGIALAVVLVKDASTPQEVAQEVAQEYGTPVVCMQDAPIIYDWNNNLIVGKMYE